jgi:hypothetical protein
MDTFMTTLTPLAKPRSPLLASLSTCLLPITALAEAPTAPTPELKAPLHGLEEVGWQDVNLRGGFWGPRLEIHHQTTIPHVLDKLEERKHMANFDVAAKVLKGGTAKQGVTDPDQAGQSLEGNAGPGSENPNGAKDGEITGHSAFDSDVHKAFEGACHTLGHCDDPALHQRVESILERDHLPLPLQPQATQKPNSKKLAPK